MIKSAGYDAQQQMLEIEFANNGQIWQFDNVPEDIWYRFRSHHLPELGREPRHTGEYKQGNEIITQEAAGIAISPAASCVTK